MAVLDAANLTFDIKDTACQDLYSVIYQGTWDGATVTALTSNDGINYVAIEDTDSLVDTTFNMLVAFAFLRFQISGGGGSQSINLHVKRIAKN